MAEGKARQHWDHTSSLLAQQANLNRGKGDRPRRPSEFHPYSQKPQSGEDEVVKVKLSELRGMFSHEEVIPAEGGAS